MVRRGTNTPKVGGGLKRGGGFGYQTLLALRQAGEATGCGNCGGTHDLMWSDRCEQLLCGGCRKLYIRVARTLPTEAVLEKKLGLTGMVCPGTHFPEER